MSTVLMLNKHKICLTQIFKYKCSVLVLHTDENALLHITEVIQWETSMLLNNHKCLPGKSTGLSCTDTDSFSPKLVVRGNLPPEWCVSPLLPGLKCAHQKHTESRWHCAASGAGLMSRLGSALPQTDSPARKFLEPRNSAEQNIWSCLQSLYTLGWSSLKTIKT